MTYRELKAALAELTEEQLDMTVLIDDSQQDEFFPVADCCLASELVSWPQQDDVIEETQPLLRLE